MELHNLKPAKGSTHNSKRLGRGQGSGKGGTSTKGNKGAQSRTGYQSKEAFEGGQMPIHRRMPKRGFISPNSVKYKVFNLEQIETLMESHGITEFSVENLYFNHLIGQKDLVKILGRGELTKAVTFKVNAASETAKAAIEKSGGTLEII